MNDFTTKTIREIAVSMPATTRIFEEYKIDFCCGGGKNFSDACLIAGVEPEVISEKILSLIDKNLNGLGDKYSDETASGLIDHIVETHHKFTRTEITRLSALMAKVAGKHSENHPELVDLETKFQALCADLEPHMRKEEVVLFPFIKHLEMSAANNLSSPRPPFGTVQNPVRAMMSEHDAAGDILKKMREISNDYLVPDGACPSYQALYFGLDELEKDLHQHIHLENNVLFPMAVKHERNVMFG